MPYKDPQCPAAKASNKRRQRRYYKKNKEKIDEDTKRRHKEYYEQNKNNWKTRYNKLRVALRRKQKYGVTEEDYDNMLKAQKNSCAICKKSTEELGYQLCVDHCHKTNVVRGLLCHNCNKGIGMLQDSIPYLKKAIKYLSQ